MNTELPSREQMHDLLTFLPRLYGDDQPLIHSWYDGAGSEGEPWVMPHPEYADVVVEFFRAASAPCWSDYEYDPSSAGAMLKEPGFVESADLSQIRTVLTYCVRGERFCDGFWAGVIEDGHIRRILERLATLRAVMA